MMRILFLFVLAVMFARCGSRGGELVEDAPVNDSLSAAIHSPELSDINKKILAEPSNDSLYLVRAWIYQRLDRPGAAVNDAKRAIRIDSTRAGNYLALVDLYFAQNQTRLAKDLLLIVESKFPQNTEALLKLAELYWLVRQYQNGIDYVNRALRIDEHLARAYYIKGGIYRESGDTNRAVSSLVTATEQNNRYVDAFYDLGVIFGARKDPIAFQYYDNVLRITPGQTDALYGRAKLMQDLGRTDDAIAAYRDMIGADPECLRCHYNLGALLLEKKKDFGGAITHFSETIRLEPGNPQNYFARGYAHYMKGDIEAARMDYKACLKIEPTFDAAAEGLELIERK